MRRPRVPELGHLVAARHGGAVADHHAARARIELHERRRRVRDDPAAEEHCRAVAAAGLPARLGGRRPAVRLRRADGRSRRRSARVPVAVRSRHTRRSSIPRDMAVGDRGVLPRTGQPEPDGPASLSRARSSRASPSSTASCSSRSKSSPAPRFAEIQIVGGGSRNRLLNQFTADATGPTGARRADRSDRARQHRDADAGDRRGGIARRGPQRSSSVPSRSSGSSPATRIAGTCITARFQDYRGADLCLRFPRRKPRF